MSVVVRACVDCGALLPPGSLVRGRCRGCLAKQEHRRYLGRGPVYALYGTAQWQRARAEVLAEEPRCRWCGAPSVLADHIIPAAQRPDLFFVRDNLAGCCASCNLRRATRPGRVGGRGIDAMTDAPPYTSASLSARNRT